MKKLSLCIILCGLLLQGALHAQFTFTMTRYHIKSMFSERSQPCCHLQIGVCDALGSVMDFLHIHFLYDPVTFLLDVIYDYHYC